MTEPTRRSDARFKTTRWSVVLAAGGSGTSNSREALAALCEQYWYPLYAYLRRAGHEASEAEDLTQGFFLRLLEKDVLAAADPDRGRFRSFMLTALKHFVANEWDRRRAQKRGGTTPAITLELSTGEHRYSLEPRDASTPETLYERRWALTVIDRALDRLRDEFRAAGKEGVFNHLMIHLSGDADAPRYAQTGAALGMSEGAVKVAVHRLRRRSRDLLRDEIADTVSSPGQIEDEIRHLISAASL